MYSQAYKQYLDANGKDGSGLDACITLLEHTSAVVELFSTNRHIITFKNDIRLMQLDTFLEWMSDWRKSCQDSKNFISSKLWFDLQSMVQGMKPITAVKLERFPNSGIKAWITNQDVVENHFCNVRACNGQNNNPSYRLQESTQNSIRVGHTTISKKCNARVR